MKNFTCNSTEELFVRYTWIEVLETFAPALLIIDRTLSPFWYCVGITGNALSLKVWLMSKMRKNNSSAIYLIALAMSDLTFLLLHFIAELKDAWGISVQKVPLFCELFNFMFITPQYLSPLLVLAFTGERYLAICHPFFKQRICRVRYAIRVSIITITFAAGLGLMQAFIWVYDNVSGKCNTRPIVSSGRLKTFYTVWTWTTEMTVFAVVPLAVLFLNVLVLFEIRKIANRDNGKILANQRDVKHKTSTVTLLSVSFFLIATTLPTTLVYSLQILFQILGEVCLSDEAIMIDPQWNVFFSYITARKIIEELCLSRYACNFIIYYKTGTVFAKVVKQLFRCEKIHRAFKAPVSSAYYMDETYKVSSNQFIIHHEKKITIIEIVTTV